ncbi:hypothetical protein V8G54_033616 [Vigna mungo]|uniref:Reverse transcriptase domain-containing protein n=1 Tax=Vigna mungo TaxID=3915 RepID=A0AAQ3RJ52_VIGMU
MGLPVIATAPYTVSLGDGCRRVTQGRCVGVVVRLEEMDVVEEFHVFELGGVDIILGVAWLAKLGDVRANWESMTMEYHVGEKTITIKGDPTLSRQLVKSKSLWKLGDDAESGALVWGLSSPEATEDGEWGTDVTGEQWAQLEKLLQSHYRLFQDMHGLPLERQIQHRIQLKTGVDPINVRPYRYPHILKGEIEKQVEEMLRAGIIRHSSSPFSSPVILVKKKDGSWRFCVDYRALNKATVPDKFPIPMIEELLDELRGARYFSKIDLKSGYHQIRMEEVDVAKTAFRTHLGHFEFLVMPFGLTNAPATFLSTMNKLLQPYLRKWVLVFFDDILAYSPNWADHLKQLEMVMQLLERNGWVANRKKYDFGKKKICYLGHHISDQGVEMDG